MRGDATADPYDRTPPRDEDAERSLIGALMIADGDAATFAGSRGMVKAADFTDAPCGVLFTVLSDMQAAGAAIDGVTIKNELARRGILDEIGGTAFIGQLLRAVPAAGHWAAYARIVRDLAARRAIISACYRTADRAYLPIRDVTAGELAADLAGLAASVAADPGDGSGPVITRMADVQTIRLRWIWERYLALGKGILWVGAPGDGKGTVAADIAARISTGSPMPDGSPGMLGSVLFIASEDGLGDVLRPRLEAAGADLERIHHVSVVRHRTADGNTVDCLLTMDNVAAIKTVVLSIPDLRLLIVDPVGNHMGGQCDTDKDNRVRAALSPLCALAEQRDFALVLIAHRRKASGGSADETAMGSRAFTGLARAVFHFGRDKQNRDIRYFLPGKTNLSKEAAGLSFTIEDCHGVGRAVWSRAPVEMSADELLTPDFRTGPEPERREAAEDFLQQLLADGPMASAEVEKQAKAAGIAWRTIRRAADALKVRRERCQFTTGWQWRLLKLAKSGPSCPPTPCADNMDNLDNIEDSPGKRQVGGELAREGVQVGHLASTQEGGQHD